MEVLTKKDPLAADSNLPHFEPHHLPSIGAVNANSVSFGWVFSQVLDVAQNVSTAILAHEVSNISAQTHVRRRTLLKTPLLGRNAFEKIESFAINQVLSQYLQTARKGRKMEISLRAMLMEEQVTARK